MRKRYSLLLVFALTSNALAQGFLSYVVLDNHVGGLIDAPVFLPDCRTKVPAGRAYLAQGYVGLEPTLLKPEGLVVPFSTPGYIPSVGLVVPGTTLNPQQVFLQMRVWQASAGSTFEAARDAGGLYGFSNVIPILARADQGPPEISIGLQSFCLIPEPETTTLLLVGLLYLGYISLRHRSKPRYR